MRPVKIVFANELAQLSIVRGTVNAFTQAAGGSLAVARQVELVVEEMITNIIKFEYLPGQKEQIELEIRCDDHTLALTFNFKGIPFDITHLKQCEQVSLDDVLAGTTRGLGLYLTQQYSDELEYRNLGKNGQQIRILRHLGELQQPLPITEQSDSSVEPVPLPSQAMVRRMRPDEAAAVSKLAYFAYDYTYIYPHIYDPEKVSALNQNGQLLSFVAIHPEHEEIVGHGALLPDQRTGLDELGIAFVNPFYRGGGCLKTLTDALMHEVRNRGTQGVFVLAVTTHNYSQKAASKNNLQEAALLVSRVQPIDMRDINDHAVARESFIFMVQLLSNQQRGMYHVPPKHQKMLGLICDHLGITAEFADGRVRELPKEGCLDQELDNYNAGHIQIISFGTDTLDQVQRIVHGWCLDRLETIYLYLPLKQPETAHLTTSFEEMGFFFGGLMPCADGNDLLLLQYLNNQRYDYGKIRAATTFGQELITYVQKCDPNSAMRGA